ncbi:MAG: CoA-acylating methylmalonate-semialdehyde dehydrogenase [Rhodospirillales bacterium]|nr:CoA-acylating methylmalonate-semialdehyde dehydrogenase [Rhodospirillales bacterium]
MSETLDHHIGGRRVPGKSERVGQVFNPSTGEVTRHVRLGGSAEVDAAVEAAQEALPAWQATPPAARARIMFRYRALLEEHAGEIAELISREHGKTLDDARGSLIRGWEVVEFACGIPHLLKGEHSRDVGAGIDTWSLMQPLGVCAGITPFNFPAMIPLWMFPLAVTCGNTFVLKPSERDPSCPLRLVELFEEAGGPPGVVNVVNGDKEAVQAILAHPDIEAVSFVGSTPVAQAVYAGAAEHGKRVQALGGAKNHLVVMPDADLDKAADALLGAAYGSAGERCMAVSVAVPVGDVADPLRDRLADRVRTLKIGPYNDPAAEMGPIVTRDSLQRIESLVARGVEEGAELVVDGRGLKLQGYEDGFYMGVLARAKGAWGSPSFPCTRSSSRDRLLPGSRATQRVVPTAVERSRGATDWPRLRASAMAMASTAAI